MDYIRSKYESIYYPKDPQILYEMIISMFLSINFTPKNKKDIQSRILFVPSDYYIYSGLVSVSGYKLLSTNKNIKKLIIIGNNYNYKEGIFIPNFEKFYANIGVFDINKELEFYFKDDLFKYDNNLDFLDIELQLPFIKSIMNIHNIYPILFNTNKYIKLVNFLKEILINNDDIGVVFCSNFSKGKNYNKLVKNDEYIIDNINKVNLKSLNRIYSSNFLKSFVILSNKMGYDIGSILYSNTGDYFKNNDIYAGYLSMYSGYNGESNNFREYS